MGEMTGFMKHLKETYICPVCIKKGWIRSIDVEIISVVNNKVNWRWKCSYIKCPASQDWQVNLEPAIRKNRSPKIGYEGKSNAENSNDR